MKGLSRMLREISSVKQHEGEGIRRWFTNDYFDLIVWYDNEDILGFQLCYDKPDFERSLTWKKGKGYSHNKIDDGEISGQNKMSPILVPDGLFAKADIAARFELEAENLEKDLFDYVYQKIMEYDNPL